MQLVAAVTTRGQTGAAQCLCPLNIEGIDDEGDSVRPKELQNIVFKFSKFDAIYKSYKLIRSEILMIFMNIDTL